MPMHIWFNLDSIDKMGMQIHIHSSDGFIVDSPGFEVRNKAKITLIKSISFGMSTGYSILGMRARGIPREEM